MQPSFDFVAGDIARWQALLAPLIVDIDLTIRRKPIGQLVKSLISGRTRDAVSLAAYHRLRAQFGSAGRIAAADPRTVEAVIANVTFAHAKAEWLVAALRRIRQEQSDFRLDFLGLLPLDAALTWLERLPGVGRKVAASVLNASTTARPVLIVDSHVLRVLRRLGFVPAGADARMASEAVTAAMPAWRADDFLMLHHGLKRLGQRFCHVVAPGCAACPLAAECPKAGD